MSPGSPVKKARREAKAAEASQPVNPSPVTIQPTDLNPATWPSQTTGTVTDAVVLARHGLEPPVETVAPAGPKVTVTPPKEIPGEGQKWACWVDARKGPCPYFHTDDLASLACPTCGNKLVMRVED